MRLLLLEDDTILGEGLRDFLHSEGHVVDWLQRLGDARAALVIPFDALIVDWQLPDGSGLEWVQGLRARQDTTPVLMITAKDMLADRIQGLDSGVDDYLVKPFAPEELVARLRAVRRRTTGTAGPRVTMGDIQLDLKARCVYRHDQLVALTAREWALLEALVQRLGRIVSKSDLENLLVGSEAELSSNALEVYISSLRRKLGRELIETIRGMGYRIAP